MKHFLYFLLMLGSGFAVWSADSAPVCNPDGTVGLGSIRIQVMSLEDSGRLQTPGPETLRNATGFTPPGKARRFESDFNTSSGVFRLTETLEEQKEGNYLLTAKLTAPAPVRVNELSLLLTLPGGKFAGSKARFDGHEITLPERFGKRHILSAKTFRTLELHGGEHTVSVASDSDLIFQDERCDGWDVFTIRTRFRPFSGMVKTAEIKLRIAVEAKHTLQLDLAAACNMGFADEIAGDGKGGWTDQGAGNDLRVFPTGRQVFNGIPFEVIDPARNGGKSCIVLSGNRSMSFPVRAEISGNGGTGRFLNLLHAAAYTAGDRAVGTVRVHYRDGQSAAFPVVTGRHLADWWGGSRISAGELVWSGLNASSLVGMYAASFPLSPKPVGRIEFETDSGAVWMLAAATLSDDPVSRVDRAPLYIVESENWKPVDYPRDVEKGSVLDFSTLGLQDAPAGKYGFVTSDREGRFVFRQRPDRPVRFYGPNLCYMGNFHDKATAEKLADRIAANGYNAVRFHHYDIMFDNAAGPSTVLKPEMLDQLEYLFYCLKQRGIYIMIDLYCTRNLSAGELPGFGERRFKPYDGKDMGSIKALLLFTDAGFENFKEFSRNLLTHVNPYTGIAWKDDPALAHISLINEDAVFEVVNYDGQVRELLTKEFDAKYPGLSGERRSRAFNRFLIGTYNRNYRRMAKFLKEELGIRTMLTDQNHWQSVHQAPMNARYDFVDKHMYWAHPRFSGKLFSQEPFSYISQMGGLALNSNSASRVFGLPFAASEMNHCFPNAHRFEGGALAGAYAALQDWGAIYQFCYLANDRAVTQDHETDLFEMATDPVMFLSEKLAVLFFLRGDVSRSELALPIHVPEEYAAVHDLYPADYMKAGTVARIGAQVGSRDGAAADVTNFSAAAFRRKLNSSPLRGKGIFAPERNYARSTTGELEIDGAAGVFKVATPRSEALILPAGKSAAGRLLAVENRQSFAGFAAAALDKRNLADSGRILVLHVTNVLNSRMKFSDQSMAQVEELGVMPHLAATGTGIITLRLAPGPVPQVFAVDLGGRRMRQVPAEYVDGALRFKAEVSAGPQPCFVYEIIRETGAATP